MKRNNELTWTTVINILYVKDFSWDKYRRDKSMFIHNLFLFHVARDEIKKNAQCECLLSDERTVKDIILHISAVNLGSF
jgi:hypothetical protein